MRHCISLRVLLSIISVSMIDAPCYGQTTDPNRAEWLTRLNAIGPDDWNIARGLAGQLAGLPPGKAAAFITGLWPELKVPAARDEIVRAMFDAEHEDAIKILRLALDDNSPRMHRTIQGIFFNEQGLNFGEDWAKIRQWIEAHQNVNYREVRLDRVREIVAQLKWIDNLGPQARQRFLQLSNPLFRDPELHGRFEQSGLFTVARDLLTGGGASPETRIAVLEIVRTAQPSEAYLRDTVWPLASASNRQVRNKAIETLACSRYKPAFELIKNAIVEELRVDQPDYRTLAVALASYGAPRAIPFLIGIIGADNDRTVYDVGYFALGNFLTGVHYNWTHDGNWWRIWWERNRAQLAVNVRDLPIPEFPHSLAYKEPIPRDCLIDPERLCDWLLEHVIAAVKNGDNPGSIAEVGELAGFGYSPAIPILIGAIEADNSPGAISAYGANGLGPLTGVTFSALHDGAWWKLWWEEHRKELPAAVRDAAIPTFPHSLVYREPISEYTHRSLDLIRTELLTRLHNAISNHSEGDLLELCRAVAALNDPRIVPGVINMIPEDPKNGSIYCLTYYGIGSLTGVKYEEGRGRAWWQNWWKNNITEYQKRYSDSPRQPDFVTASYKPTKPKPDFLSTAAGYTPRIRPPISPSIPDPDDIKDVSSERFFVNGDSHKLYRLVGFSSGAPVPAAGYKLLVVLPGGDGSEEFRQFIRRVKKNALPADVLVAELVAPKFSDWQYSNEIWPTRMSEVSGDKFHTEQFVEDVIADVEKKTRIDSTKVCTFAWGTSGSAAYTHSATANTHICGSYIAMGWFTDGELPDPSMLKDRRFFIYHAQGEFIPEQYPKDAVDYLTVHGAHVKTQEYPHGKAWTGDFYKIFRKGIEWLFDSE